VEGHAELLRESPGRREIVARFLDRYHPYLEDRWGGRALPADRTLFRIVPRRVSSWGLPGGEGGPEDRARRSTVTFALRVLSEGDHFTVICAECGAETRNEYLGYDQGRPSFKGTCRTCGISKVWNLTSAAWAGLPLRPAHR
jgi:hypothetical protein